MQIGELFIVGFYGKTVPAWVKEFASNYGLGGVVLFDYSCQKKAYDNNIDSPEQLRTLCKEISSLPSYPMVFIDQEGGLVRRLKENKGFKPLPSQKDFNLLPESEKKRVLSASFKEVRQLGINYNFAPVIDVDYNQENPNIGAIKRSYSSDINEVEKNTLLASGIAKDIGIGLCLKHYPGIGGAKVDSHQEIMDLSDALYQEQEELFYKLAPKTFGNAIVVSHAIINQWDKKYPITLSPAVIGRIRDKLPDTLIISDDMQMQGLQKTMATKEATFQSLKAGMDMICIGNNLINQEEEMLGLAAYIEECMKNEKLNKAEIQKSINRVKDRKKLVGVR